jgi:hypothetical protein
VIWNMEYINYYTMGTRTTDIFSGSGVLVSRYSIIFINNLEDLYLTMTMNREQSTMMRKQDLR